MTLQTNTAEGGVDATPVTTANSGSGSGTAFSLVSAGSGGAITFQASGAYRGGLSYNFSQPTAATSCLVELADATPAAAFAARAYVFISTMTPADMQFPLMVRSSSAVLGSISMNATGQVKISVGSGGTTTTSTFSTATLTTGVWYRFEYVGTGFGSTATASSVSVYAGDSTTPILTVSVSGGTTAATADRVRFGKPSSGGVVAMRLDDLGLNIGSATPLGPTTPPSAPDAGPDQVNVPAGATVTLTGSGAGAWSQTGGTTVTLGGSGTVRTFTAPASTSPSTLTFSYGGDTMTVSVLAVDLGGTQTNTAEGGTASSPVTTANSGDASGQAFSTVSAPGGSVVFTSSAYRGSLAYLFTQSDAAAAALVDMDGPGPSDSFSIRFYLKLSGLPATAGAQFPVAIRSLSAAIGRLEMSDTGQIRIQTGGASTYSTPVLAVGTWYRVEWFGSGVGTTATTSTVNVYVGDATGTPFISVTLSGQTTTVQAQRIRYGKIAGGSAIAPWTIDNIAQLLGVSVPLGPTAAGPTGDAGPDQLDVEPGATVTLTGTGTGTWTQTTGAAVTLAGSGNTRTFVAPPTVGGATLGFSFGGDSLLVSVLPVTERAVVGGVEVPLQLLLAS